jgi:diguanylate cyclase (GGDEF)-like protein
MEGALRFILSLRLLIVTLSLSGVLFTIVNGYYSTYQIQKNLLINASLESNRVYSEKLAHMAEGFFKNAKSQLAAGAILVAPMLERKVIQPAELQLGLDQISNMSQGFNSVSILDRNGIILSISPKSIGLEGRRLSDSIISNFEDSTAKFMGPITGPTGTYLSVLSHPIFSKTGEYIGDLLGTIYLHENRFLDRLLSQHGYVDGSYVYVVSPQKDLIYHPLKNRIGEKITNNEVINRVSKGQNGSLEVVNSKNVSMVTGYAYVHESGWGVVAQTPRATVLNELDRQLWLVMKETIPIQILILTFIVVSAYFIARPLRQLAQSTTSRDRSIKIRAWFYEAYLLKKAIWKEIDFLSDKVSRFDEDRKKDALTDLMNRRAMDELVASLTTKMTPFSVIFFDIDHFKQVNDKFGHDVGDDVLRAIAKIVSQKVNNEGVLIRSGGEEFIVILPGKKPKQAIDLAEEIRVLVAQEVIPQISKPITISLGVSNWDNTMKEGDAFKLADLAMYESKNAGRNRVTSCLNN